MPAGILSNFGYNLAIFWNTLDSSLHFRLTLMQSLNFLACFCLMCFRIFVFVSWLVKASKAQSLTASNLQVASAGDAKRKQSAARRTRQACWISRRPFSCGKPCRRPDMLVMSLSPLLGQAIPDIAETAEILVFPRRGARSGSCSVPKPYV